MNFPKIEFYVAYNDERELEEADKTLVIDLGDIQVTAQMVDIRFDSLPKEKAEDTQNALAGYAYFAKIFEEMKSEGKTPYQAYTIAVEKSKENGYLADIWSRKECVDVFRETYCYDDQLREEGMEKGIELSTLIFSALRENVPLPAIAKKHGITVQQVEKMKEAFAI